MIPDGADVLGSLGKCVRETLQAPPISQVAGLKGVPSGVGAGGQFLSSRISTTHAAPDFSAAVPVWGQLHDLVLQEWTFLRSTQHS